MTKGKNSFARFGPAWLALVVLLSAWGARAPGQPKDEDDPFAAPGNLTNPFEPNLNPVSKKLAGLIELQAAFGPAEAKPGEVVRLTITGKPKAGYHTYPVTQRTPDQSKSQLTRIDFADNPALKPLWPVTETPPAFETVEGVGTYLVLDKPFTWSQDVLVLPEAKPGSQTLRLTITLQVCDEHGCIGPAKYPPVQAELTVAAGPAKSLTAALQERLKAKPPEPQVVAAPANRPGAVPPPGDGPKPVETQAPAAEGKDSSLAVLLLSSMGAAFAMLLTPCVFPMIPITVSFFLKQSERQDHKPLMTAGVYSVTIILVLALAVLVLGEFIVRLANNAWLNLGLGTVLVFFALSLFGMYEIELPSGLARFTAAREGQGGYAGAMFMALTFTITSFTCTGPFLGPLLVAVKESKLTFADRTLGALVYSATFAAPFFVLALFPGMLKKLPKSGGWLNAVKVVMGFLELAAALKFLANTDLAWNPGNPVLFNYDTVLCAWIALSVACGLYLLGVFQLPHDSPVEYLGVVRMLLAAVFLGLAVYMMPALWRVTPQGVIGSGLVAFLPLDTREPPPTGGGKGEGAELTWLRDYEEAWRQATRDNKLIFIDFTGQNCTNCRYNEKNVFPVPAVHQELAKYVRVQLYTDFVPDASLSSGQSQAQGNRNSGWQSETFGDVTNPLYAVIRPDRTGPFDGPAAGPQKLKGQILGVRKGLIPKGQIPDFEGFLREPQKEQARLASAG